MNVSASQCEWQCVSVIKLLTSVASRWIRESACAGAGQIETETEIEGARERERGRVREREAA